MTITDVNTPSMTADMTTDEGTEKTMSDHKSSLWVAARDTYRSRRAVRAEYRQAERELSTYTSAADIQELDAMLERSVDADDTVYAQIIQQIRLRAA